MSRVWPFVAALVLVPRAWPQPAAAWPDSYVGRLQALALVQTIHAEILASRSSTLTLERWCRSHHLATEPRIVADRVKDAAKSLTAEQRERLQVASDDEVRYRRVQLRCGTRVLAEADNWYVPSRLTAAMNRLLETTDTPFGRAVQALEPYRLTFRARLLWSPLPEGWESEAARPAVEAGSGGLAIPESLFEHSAVLYTREHKPFSLVEEVYKRPLLGFPPPP